MRKVGALALIAGLLSASCAGHGGNGVIPPSTAQSNARPSSLGMQSTVSSASIAPAGWAGTATQAINLANATSLGALPDSQPITIHVALQLRNTAQLNAAVAARQIVPRATFMSTYAPTNAQMSQVSAYLQSEGFSNIKAEPNNLFVSGSATAAQVAKAFDTQLTAFSQNGLTVFANTQPAYVPQALAGTVIAVLGLNDAQAAKTGPKKTAKSKPTPTPSPGPTAPPTPAPTPTASPTPVPQTDACTASSNGVCARFYDPGAFQVAYDAAAVPAATKTSIAIMTEGQLSQSIADFRTNESAFNMGQAPISVVQVQPQSSDTSGNTEWTLDMTYSTAMAGNVNMLYLYNVASLSDSDIVMEYNRWVTDDLAQIGNSSFGGCEAFPYQDGSMLAADEVLVEAASQGQTMFVSTGDTGAYCGLAGVPPNGAPGGLPFVEWPAASPYVVAVGGTDLFSNPDGSYLGESAWEAGGGGVSQFEYSPYWEQNVQPVSSTPAGLSFRGLPDVAMDAALETGGELYTSSPAANGSCTPCITGGTSLASPLAAGSYARMQTAHGNLLGFAPPALYQIYLNNPNATETSGGPPPTQLRGGFHDVLSGTNGGYTALPGFDYTTGLGSFDVAKTNAVIGQ